MNTNLQFYRNWLRLRMSLRDVVGDVQISFALLLIRHHANTKYFVCQFIFHNTIIITS